MHRILKVALAASLAVVGFAVKYPGCTDTPNVSPVLDLPPQDLGSVANGQAWKMEQGTNVVYLVRVAGTAYEMGYAMGQLVGKEIAANIANLDYYIKWKAHQFGDQYGIPAIYQDYLIEQLMPVFHSVLDLNKQIAMPFIPQRWIDEIQGIADGSNGKVTTD